MRVPRRVCAIAAPVLAAGLLAGCASTVAGTARFAGLGSDGATVSAAQLDGLFPDAGAVADLARTGPLGAPRTYSPAARPMCAVNPSPKPRGRTREPWR